MDDIPLPEELEWLESNGLLPEEEEENHEIEFPLPPEEEEEEGQQQNQFYLPPSRADTSGGYTSPSSATNFLSKSTSSIFADSQINNYGKNKKRSWSKSQGDSDSVDDPLDVKRNRLVHSFSGRQGEDEGGGGTSSVEIDAENEVEEDWLRYSPSVPVEVEKEQEKFIFRFASDVDGDCISVTGPSGDRVYAKMMTTQLEDTSNNYFASSNKKLTTTTTRTIMQERFATKGLISEPVTVLMERLEQDALTKALQVSSESSDALIDHQSSVTTEHLWVSKYAPNSFTELLSDEQTNREVLLWLKQWDSCVFGSEIRSTTADVLSSLRRHSSLAQHQKLSGMNPLGKNSGPGFASKAFKHSDSLNREDNNIKSIHESWYMRSTTMGSRPPDQKVLLLCGPPGLGKTTLAHVAAKHCGYRVVEINASDDRSSATIEAKILDVVQMNSVMADAKPKCLIIDEIDGALGDGKGAVEVILRMIAAEKKYEAGKENVSQKEQRGKSLSKRGKKTAMLSRPVICICNDLFAPSLRPLRQVAKVHMFVKPTINRVVSRLKYICNKEGFRTSSTALTALAVHTECDIRSCLNTLQFLNKQKETLNLLEISSQVGYKDMSKSVFDVWKEVFQKRKPKKEQKSFVSSMSSDFDSLHFLISNCGEYELTMDGVHENILQLHYHDPMMQKTVNCLNILGVSDHLHQYIMRTQQMSLLAYQPSTAIAISRQIAQIRRPNIEWPKSSQRYRTMLIEKKDLLRCWCNKISPTISRHLSTESFVGDGLSPLLYILSPPTLRPVALHLLSEREKHDLAQLVNTMVSYSISYKNMNPETLPSNPRHEAVLHAATLSLDPPIVDFINFKDYTSGHSGLSLAMKQVLVHEVEKQKILSGSISRSVHSNDGNNTRNQALHGEGGKATSIKTDTKTAYVENVDILNKQSPLRQSKDNNSTNSSTSGSNESIAADMEPMAPGVVKKPSGSSSGFFDRFRKIGGKFSPNPDNVMQKQATLERDSRPLIFKFNEGFTNAVKRPVRIAELLL